MLNSKNDNRTFFKSANHLDLDHKKVQNCLPSFLLENNDKDDYFDDNSSDDEKENETKKPINETNGTTKNMFNKSFIMDHGKNIFDSNINRNYTYSNQNLNVIRSNSSSMGSNKNSQYQMNVNNNDNNNPNNIINNIYNNNKNYGANSFNQPIIHPLYQNYINLII